MRAALALIVIGAAAGCGGPLPPTRWVSGGATLELPNAQFTYKGDPVEIRSRGGWAEVVVDGDVELVLDRVGRVYTRRRQPYALLEPDGRLVGLDEDLLGIVGAMHAALPGKASAWITVTPQGQVIQYDGAQGDVRGQWSGCGANLFAAHTCVLVTYLLFFRDEGEGELAPSASMGPSLGTSVFIR